MTGLRVVLAEDDVLLREGLASLLDRSGYEVAGQAGDGTAAYAGPGPQRRRVLYTRRWPVTAAARHAGQQFRFIQSSRCAESQAAFSPGQLPHRTAENSPTITTRTIRLSSRPGTCSTRPALRC